MIDQLHQRLLSWREKNIKEQQFILILSFIIGIVCAGAAAILHLSIHWISDGLSNYVHDQKIFLPIIGIFFTILFVRNVVKDDVGHGVSKILYAISRQNGRIKTHNMWTSIIASTLTIGFGGSVGAEAPIVLTGASIGSGLGRLFKMNHKTLILLIGCGSAGAISGIFKAPIAGIVFVIEVLMIDLTMASLVPLLISGVTAALFSYIFVGGGFLFVLDTPEVFKLPILPYIFILGIVSGFISLFFTKGVLAIELYLKKQKNIWIKLLVGGLVLSLLIFLFPPLFGEGYRGIGTLVDPKRSIDALFMNSPFESLFNGSFFNVRHSSFVDFLIPNAIDPKWVLLVYLALVLFCKILSTSLTTGIGGIGGIFAPTLFIGAFTGFFVAHVLNTFFGLELSESLFALVGMAGTMSGVMYAPLTAIFLIVEITGGYALFIPLMVVSTISYLVVMAFERHGIYTKHLAERGELLTHHKDKTVLTLLKLDNLIETDLLCVTPDATLGELVKTISQSKRNIFPVVDEEGMLQGIILLDDLRNIMFRPEKYDSFIARELMSVPPGFVRPGQSMEDVMSLFERTQAWNLPVVDEGGRYIGFLSKSKIFNSYRRVLVHYSDE